MATLADELLNDFEASGSEGEADGKDDLLDTEGAPSPSAHNGSNRVAKSLNTEGAMELDGDEEEEDAEGEAQANAVALNAAGNQVEDEEEAKARVEKMQLGGVSDVRSVAKLMKTLDPTMARIAHFQALPPEKRTRNIGSVEDNPEYKLLTLSNTLSTSIDGEIVLVHKFIRDHYSVRFPELETLIPNPLDYARTVAAIGNGPMEDMERLLAASDNLVGHLDKHSILLLLMESRNTKGRELSESELQIVRRACEMTLQLDRAKSVLGDYVQSRMNLFAPNLTALIGSLTAAQLLNFAGGLTGLAKTPACNIPPLGSKKQSQAGLATNVGVRHQGFLYNSPVIKNVPSDLRKQAMRIVSAKVVLAARVDRVHSSPDGSIGEDLRQQCEDRLEKLTEPPPNKGVRALPAPDDKPARKRGGRRARKAKEATAMTDLRKAQNRMAFGKEEQEVGYGAGDATKGLGMIGQGNDGRIRAQQIDQRTKAKLSKKNLGWGGATPAGGLASSLRGFGQGAGNASVLRGHGLRTAGVGSTAGAGAGTASTIAFTPVQGLELVDPKAREALDRKRKAEDDRWFNSGTFTQVGSQPAKLDSGGFKVPQIPPKKKVDTGAAK